MRGLDYPEEDSVYFDYGGKTQRLTKILDWDRKYFGFLSYYHIVLMLDLALMI